MLAVQAVFVVEAVVVPVGLVPELGGHDKQSWVDPVNSLYVFVPHAEAVPAVPK